MFVGHSRDEQREEELYAAELYQLTVTRSLYKMRAAPERRSRRRSGIEFAQPRSIDVMSGIESQSSVDGESLGRRLRRERERRQIALAHKAHVGEI